MKKTFLIEITLVLILSFSLLNDASMAQPMPVIDKVVLISTSLGDIKIKLYNETPKHRDNFIKLVNKGAYDGTIFHRVIQNFMIQGGDLNSKDAGANDILGRDVNISTIPAEINPKFIHKKGALAAARTNNPKKESSGSQFYIVQGNILSQADIVATGKDYTPEQRKIYMTIGGYPSLDGGYTVFGEVIEGLDVVDKIAAVKTAKGDRPLEDIKVTMKVIN